MVQDYLDGRPEGTTEVWHCAGCQAPLGGLAHQPGSASVVLLAPQLRARVTLPFTWLCGRCGAPNSLTQAALDLRWAVAGAAD
jgi:hypothetical protein